MREIKSNACWDPVVITTSSGLARIPSSAITSQICSRSNGWPCPLPYCNASVPCFEIKSCTTSAIISIGKAERFGMPPANETISGREATAKSARISLATMPPARLAKRFSSASESPVCKRFSSDIYLSYRKCYKRSPARFKSEIRSVPVLASSSAAK